MFVVLGASGNTGKVVAETLLQQKKKVRVALHDAAKGMAWGDARADVAIAGHEQDTGDICEHVLEPARLIDLRERAFRGPPRHHHASLVGLKNKGLDAEF